MSEKLYKLVGTMVLVVEQAHKKVVFGKLVCLDAAKDTYAIQRSDPRHADYLLTPADLEFAGVGLLKLRVEHAAKFDV